jgi:hypothetical protein
MSCRTSCIALAYLAFVIGCAPSAPSASPVKTAAGKAHDDHDDHDDHGHEHDDHDHGHDHGDHEEPETVAQGIAQLEKLCADAKAHLAAGDFGKADGPVHMVGHLLEDLGELGVKEKPAAEAEARKALDAIFECFDKVDTAIHSADDEARKKLDYAEHAPAIEAAIAKLKELAK